MDDARYEPVSCPADGCAYEDAVRSVAAHVSGTDDGEHSWERLGYDGALAFVKDEKRRQEADGSGAARSADETRPEEAADDGPDSERATDDGSTERDGVLGETDGPIDLSFARAAVAVAALGREYEGDSLAELDAFRLSNLYALLSAVASGADDARREVRDALLEEVQDDREIESDVGTVRRATYERTELRDEETVREALDRAGVDPTAVTSFDRGKLEDAVDDAPLDPADVFETEERPRVRRTDVDESSVEAALRDVDVDSLFRE